jgi:hypothetical protein
MNSELIRRVFLKLHPATKHTQQTNASGGVNSARNLR